MIFGGIPFYLDLLDPSMSLTQNIDGLCFDDAGQLQHEFERLFATLFKHPDAYERVVNALAHKKIGMTRKELRRLKGMEGSRLTTVLSDLELCDFVRSYRDFTKRKRGAIYQLVDPFTLFHQRFIEPRKVESWAKHIGSPDYNAWSENAFEMYCLNNVDMLKSALGVSGVQTSVCAWRSERANPDAQIDLLIKRADNIINVCEMKFAKGEYAIDAAYERALRNKLLAFEEEVRPRAAVHLTMVTLNGISHNAHFNAVVQSEVCISEEIRTIRRV